MRSMTRLAILLLSLMLVAVACSGDDDADSTTTTAAAGGVDATLADPVTGDGGADDDAGDGTTTTTIDLGGAVVPEFEIVSREEGDDGDTVVVLLDPSSYERLTDIDIQNVVANVVEEFAPVEAAHVIDDAAVADLVLAPDEADGSGEQLLDVHYLAELDEGSRLTFRGPFSDEGVVILGS